MTDNSTDRARPWQLPSGAPVLAGIDGSDQAARGMMLAAELASRLDVELVVVHALGLFSRESGWRTPTKTRENETVELLRSTWCAPLGDIDGLRWRWRVVQGAAVDVILWSADDVDAGFIVLGSHGAGDSDEPLLGSTSHWVLRNSRRPVLVIPPDDDHRHHRSHSGGGVAGRVVAESS